MLLRWLSLNNFNAIAALGGAKAYCIALGLCSSLLFSRVLRVNPKLGVFGRSAGEEHSQNGSQRGLSGAKKQAPGGPRLEPKWMFFVWFDFNIACNRHVHPRLGEPL